MYFNFPQKTNVGKTVIQFAIETSINEKINKLARQHECSVAEIYTVLITESIEEYELKYGSIITKSPLVDLEERQAIQPFDIMYGQDEGPDGIAMDKKPYEKDSRAEKKESRWARDYDSCIDCGSTERKHMGHGKCTRCYFIKKSPEMHNSSRVIKATIPNELKTAFCSNPECPDPDTPHYKISMIGGEEGHKEDLYCTDLCREVHAAS